MTALRHFRFGGNSSSQLNDTIERFKNEIETMEIYRNASSVEV